MSGGQIAYHLRVNKFIDRMLFVEALQVVRRYISLDEYGYVSMAGAYMEDCRLIHQSMRITRMYSFDTDKAVIARQMVNRPFGFIQTHRQSSKELVVDFDAVRLALGGSETNAIVWLDYTNPRERRSQLQELGTLVTKLIGGDIVRITLNANRASIGENSEYLKVESANRPTLPQWRHQRLFEQLGEYFPANINTADYMQSNEGLCETLLRAIKQVVIGALHPRPELIAFPLLSTMYDDQHCMLTATVLFLEAEKRSEFETAARWNEWEHSPGEEWDNFVEIQVPHLSVRERHLVHGAIEAGGMFGGNSIHFETLPELEDYRNYYAPSFMTPDELEQYRTHYLRYPTFAPLDIL